MMKDRPGITIRDERPDDYRSIARITSLAFENAPHSSETEAVIIEGLRKAGAMHISLVAECLDAIVGHIAVSPVTIAGTSGQWFGLGPVSVLPNRQRQGIGSQLIRDALQRLRTEGASGCVVLGDPAYYSRFGFAHDPRLRFADVPPPYFQRVIFSGTAPEGEVIYHPAFFPQ